MRFFNTAGPVRCQKHYCLPPLERFNLDEIISLIDQEKYFVLHAPRQTGKTSCLLALMEYLNAGDKYNCLYCNVESAQAAREDVNKAIQAILNELGSQARYFLKDAFVDSLWPDILKRSGGYGALNEVLTRWAEKNTKPLVILIDEIDSLVGDTLISVLRQLRAGYTKRSAMFPQSIILCGVRDVRDYRIHSSKEKTIITGGSAFNIRAESLRLGDFEKDEIAELFGQHTAETGQIFSDDAVALVWELTEGQPWLVNALGYEVCFRMKSGRDRTKVITDEMVRQAKESIVLRRETHIDQLTDKLREERVRRIIQPILAGKDQPEQLIEDDVQYVEDLGLIKTKGQLRIANGIYREIIPRSLIYTTQLTISHEPAWYIRSDNGCLDMDKLLTAFQDFFRKHSEHWIDRFDYKEAGPQLLLQGFLQRIVNSGGRVEREYGLGRMRTDLFVTWQCKDGVQKIVLELKILYGSLEQTIENGLDQSWRYMDQCGADEGHLIIFDRYEKKPWAEKIFKKEELFKGIKIKIWGM
ncbi:MAG: ATP-binding protein [Thermodesulfobacteriota bacterium]|nr:ATP-binding protein [Thermodesulfobacteriota bacterium]